MKEFFFTKQYWFYRNFKTKQTPIAATQNQLSFSVLFKLINIEWKFS
jgi:hypothetical protein